MSHSDPLPRQGTLLRNFSGRRVSAVALTAAGARVVTANLNSKLIVWNGHTGDVERVLHSQAKASRLSFALLPDGRRIVLIGSAGGFVLDLETGEKLKRLEGTFSGQVGRIAVSSDGEVVAACFGASKLWGGQWTTVWSSATGRTIQKFSGQPPDTNMPSVIHGRFHCSVAVGSSPR